MPGRHRPEAPRSYRWHPLTAWGFGFGLGCSAWAAVIHTIIETRG